MNVYVSFSLSFPVGLFVAFCFSRSGQYATSCPANLGAHFGRPPGSKRSSMSVVEEGAFGEEGDGEGEEGSLEPKSKTALSILESLASAEQIPVAAAPAEGSGVDAESVESADSVGGSPIEDDVFELEGLDGLDGVRKMEWKYYNSYYREGSIY